MVNYTYPLSVPASIGSTCHHDIIDNHRLLNLTSKSPLYYPTYIKRERVNPFPIETEINPIHSTKPVGWRDDSRDQRDLRQKSTSSLFFFCISTSTYLHMSGCWIGIYTVFIYSFFISIIVTVSVHQPANGSHPGRIDSAFDPHPTRLVAHWKHRTRRCYPSHPNCRRTTFPQISWDLCVTNKCYMPPIIPNFDYCCNLQKPFRQPDTTRRMSCAFFLWEREKRQ